MPLCEQLLRRMARELLQLFVREAVAVAAVAAHPAVQHLRSWDRIGQQPRRVSARKAERAGDSAKRLLMRRRD
jgi:hypothetical protein